MGHIQKCSGIIPGSELRNYVLLCRLGRLYVMPGVEPKPVMYKANVLPAVFYIYSIWPHKELNFLN